MIILTKKFVDLGISLPSLGVTSRYKLQVRKADSEILLRESGWSKNLIVTNGINCALRGTWNNGASNAAAACRVGTGNTPPALNQSDLVARHGGSSVTYQSETATMQAATSPFWRKTMLTFRFAAGTFNNTNIAEVGVFGSASASTGDMYSRALVLDANGNPAAVTLLNDEVLDVLWEHYLVTANGSGNFNQLIDGVSTPFTFQTRPIELTSAVTSSWWLGARDVPFITPRGSGGTNDSENYRSATALAAANSTSPVGAIFNDRPTSAAGAPAFVPGSGVRALRFSTPLNNSNGAGGINAFKFNLTACSFQMLISPAVLKVPTKTYVINLELSMANTALPE